MYDYICIAMNVWLCMVMYVWLCMYDYVCMTMYVWLCMYDYVCISTSIITSLTVKQPFEYDSRLKDAGEFT